MDRILIIDTDCQLIDWFRRSFAQSQFSFQIATTAAEALTEFRQNSFDVVISNIRLPDSSGLQLLESIQEIDFRIPVILIAGNSNASVTIEAIRRGAYHYFLKPLELDDVVSVVKQAVETSRMARNQLIVPFEPDEGLDDGELLIGECPAMREVYRQIGRVAGQDVTVLILGESGTGKEVVARAIYQHSKRAFQSYLAINCAAIPETLLESELFGHEKGSFTGAERMRVGKFEQCNGGTLFLDEIGDMTPLMQTKVLRVLQDQQFERVGGTESVRTSVRLIAATNCDLTKMMKEGTFRGDLYYRLNVYTIRLPPLRERTSDLPLLIKHFVNRYSRELDKKIQNVSPQAMKMLAEYTWPGNIRELQSVLKHAIIEATGSVILPEFLSDSVRNTSTELQATIANSIPTNDQLAEFIRERIESGTANLYEDVIQPIERQMLVDLMHQLEGNLTRAAAVLGISRSTLRSKLLALDIISDRVIQAAN